MKSPAMMFALVSDADGVGGSITPNDGFSVITPEGGSQRPAPAGRP